MERIENTSPNSSIVALRGYPSGSVEKTIPLLLFTAVI
jgi:hypothetical protein